MTSTGAMAPIALLTTADGVIRISQVTLDTAIHTFLTGASPASRPGHREVLRHLFYLLERRSRAEAQRREIAARSGHSGPRGRLHVRLGR